MCYYTFPSRTHKMSNSSLSSSSSSSTGLSLDVAATCDNRSLCSDNSNPYSCYVSAYLDCATKAFTDNLTGFGYILGIFFGAFLFLCFVCMCCYNQTRIWTYRPTFHWPGRKRGYTALSTSDTNSNLTRSASSGLSPGSILGGSSSVLNTPKSVLP